MRLSQTRVYFSFWRNFIVRSRQIRPAGVCQRKSSVDGCGSCSGQIIILQLCLRKVCDSALSTLNHWKKKTFLWSKCSFAVLGLVRDSAQCTIELYWQVAHFHNKKIQTRNIQIRLFITLFFSCCAFKLSLAHRINFSTFVSGIKNELVWFFEQRKERSCKTKSNIYLKLIDVDI